MPSIVQQSSIHTTIEPFTFGFLLGWIACIVAGGFAGSGKSAAKTGAILGALLGPLGVIAALGLDGRCQCPKCTGRVDSVEGMVCQHCRTPLIRDSVTGGLFPDEPEDPQNQNEKRQ